MKALKYVFTSLPIAIFAITPIISLCSCGTKISISITKTSLSLNVGQSYPLYATANVRNSASSIKWTSSDESIATVSNGMVKAIKKGSCKIVATFSTGSATCNLTINDATSLDKMLSFKNESSDKVAIFDFTKDSTNPANLQYYDVATSSWKEVIENIEILPNTSLVIRGNNYNGFNVKKTDGTFTQNYIKVITKDVKPVWYGEQAQVSLTGSILGLIDNGGEISLDSWEMPEGCFYGVFCLSTAIKNVNSNFLCNDKLLKMSNNCYTDLFAGCTTLTEAPELPAGWTWGGNLSKNCYLYMFRYCIYLKKPPVLAALELKEGCYQEMFRNCDLHIYEDSANDKMFFTCPNTIPTDATKDMFLECCETVPDTPTPGKIYYYR